MGAVTARRLASSGFTVFAGARHPDRVVDELRGAPDASTLDIRPVALDVTDDASVRAAAQEVSRAVDALDVLINNAGVSGTWAAAEGVRADDFDDVIATNLLGPVRVTQACLPGPGLLAAPHQTVLACCCSGAVAGSAEAAVLPGGDPVGQNVEFLLLDAVDEQRGAEEVGGQSRG